MSGNWTKGPLRLDEFDALVIVNAEGSSLGEAVPGDPYISEEEARANAILWTAAPDMAEALETLLVKFANCARAAGNDADVIDLATEQARAALQKARGQ